MSNDLAPWTSAKEPLHQALLAAGSSVRNNKYFCPFHDDGKTPNGAIHEHDGKWSFKCFSCGAKGDYFDILAHAQNRPVEEIIKEHVRENSPPPAPRPQAQGEVKKPKHTWHNPADVAAWAARHFRGDVTQQYEYNDPDTNTLEYVVFRVEPFDGGKKQFTQCHRTDDGWQVGLPKDCARPLYNRARIRKAGTIVFVEGEKCVHALNQVGIVATSCLGGVNSVDYTDWSPLAGKDIILWPDNDAPDPKTGKIPGQVYIQGAAKHLDQLDPAPSLRTLDPQVLNLGPKEDAADYVARELQRGRTKEQIREDLLEHFRHAQRHGASAGVAQRVQAVIDGTHVPIPWMHPQLSRQTRALLPGTVTIVGGTPGSGKSWFVLENIMDMHDRGVSVAVLMLEENRTYWVHRAMAIRDGNSLHFDEHWVQTHPKEAMAAVEHHAPWLDEFGKTIHVTSRLYTDMRDVVSWVAEQAARKTRVIVVDPITLAVCEGDLFREELKFLSEMKGHIDAAGSSLILVTHPKQGNQVIGMNAMAGSAAYQRACQCILWMEHLDEDTEMDIKVLEQDHFGAPVMKNVTIKCNRKLWLLKTRNSSGHGLKIAYHFYGKHFSFVEQGLIASSQKKNKAGATAHGEKTPRKINYNPSED
jgi:nucleoside-triphosphatase THEP1